MIKYEVNQLFPFPHPMPGAEVTLSDITTSFFDVKCYMSGPTPDEIKDWRKGTLKYGLYIYDYCPFFIVDFERWNLDVSINLLKVQSEEQQDVWLNESGNLINLFLIDSETNTLRGMRTISVQKDMSEKLRDCLEFQTDFYQDANSCERRIAELQHTLTTQEMINSPLCKMYKL